MYSEKEFLKDSFSEFLYEEGLVKSLLLGA